MNISVSILTAMMLMLSPCTDCYTANMAAYARCEKNAKGDSAKLKACTKALTEANQRCKLSGKCR